MENFFTSVLSVVTGNEGIIPVVVIFAFAMIVTAILKKTTSLNQKQSYAIIALVFVGLMVFLVVIYSLFMTPTKGAIKKQSDVKIENSLKDINASKVSLSGKIDMKDSAKNISGSTIIIK